MPPTSPDVPGLLLVVSSPVPSSLRARRNSLLRSGPRRISFSLDGAMSMGGVVLEGCCRYDVPQEKTEGEGMKTKASKSQHFFPQLRCQSISYEIHLVGEFFQNRSTMISHLNFLKSGGKVTLNSILQTCNSVTA